jgi:hypothetical protein
MSLRPESIRKGDAGAALPAQSIRVRLPGGPMSALVTRDQAAKVVGIESHRTAKVDGHKLAALDEALDRSGMDVQEFGGLMGRQKRWSGRVAGGRDVRRAVVGAGARIRRGVVA